MSGEDLFNLWAEAMAEEGVDVDGWEHVEEAEAMAWRRLAEQVKLA